MRNPRGTLLQPGELFQGLRRLSRKRPGEDLRRRERAPTGGRTGSASAGKRLAGKLFSTSPTSPPTGTSRHGENARARCTSGPRGYAGLTPSEHWFLGRTGSLGSQAYVYCGDQPIRSREDAEYFIHPPDRRDHAPGGSASGVALGTGAPARARSIRPGAPNFRTTPLGKAMDNASGVDRSGACRK